MTKYRDFAFGEPLPSGYLRVLQELIGSYVSPTFNLVKVSDTVLRVVAGASNDKVGIAIDGRWRYTEANVDATHPGGAAATFEVYVGASDNSFSGAQPETDSTVYAFTLHIRAIGSPPATTLHRKVGSVVWDGSKIVTVVNDFTRVATGLLAALPIGAIMPFAGATAPPGFLLCNGQSVLQSAYQALYVLLGSGAIFGGSGTHFNVPTADDVGIMGVGAGAVNDVGGLENVTLTAAEMAAHQHDATSTPTHTHSTSSDGGHVHGLNTTGNHSHLTGVAGYHNHGFASGAGVLQSNNIYDTAYGGQGYESTTLVNFVSHAGHSHVIASDGGSHTHTLGAVSALATHGAHTHTVGSAAAHTHTLTSAGSGSSHSNLPAYAAANFVIKAT